MYPMHLDYPSQEITLDRPMNICAVHHRAAFYVDFYTAAYIILEHDRKRNRVPRLIQEVINEGQFDNFARIGELTGDYHDTDTAFMILRLNNIPAVQIKNAYVHVKTEFPNLAGNAEINIKTKNENVTCIPAQKIPQLFKPGYNNANELLQEYQSQIGQTLPGDFNYWKNVCLIIGNHIVYQN